MNDSDNGNRLIINAKLQNNPDTGKMNISKIPLKYLNNFTLPNERNNHFP